PGIHVATGGAPGVGETGQVLVNPQTGEPLPGPEGGGTATGQGASGASQPTGSQGAAATQGSTQARAGDTDGITATEIKIGLHAPLTGAAAVPLVDIQRGTGIYSSWLKGKGGSIHGRHMTTIWRDDQYSPSEAVRQCADLVEKQKVFMLVGGAGTDQILACARYAASKGVPYLSAGVTENVVKGLNNYFAVSMSYPQQGKLLAEMVHKFDAGSQGGKVFADRCDEGAGAAGDPFCRNIGDAAPKVAVVYSNTDGIYDGRDAFLRAWKEVSGKDVDQTFAITKFNIAAGEANSLVQRLKSGGFDVVYPLTSPTNWLSILRVSEGQQYAPRWVGVGLTMGINTVATTACGQSGNSFANSLFLNPWFSVDSGNARQFAEGWGGDYRDHDIAFGLWGISIAEHSMLDAVGKDITRSKFIS
ncbi:MAG: ABC transporter substrate-binding protein, partial [Acidimicrobiia bacterium]